MPDIPNFDLKQNFPVAPIAQLYADRSKKEQDMRFQQQQQVLQGLNLFKDGVDSLVKRRIQQAQALSQADLLLKDPEIAGKAGLENPVTQPVANVAAAPAPPTIGQTAQGTDDQGNILENPIQNMPSIPRNMELLRQRFATAIQGTKGDDFLKYLKPDMVQDTQYKYDAQGNPTGSTTTMVPKGSKSTVVRPQPVPQPRQPVPMSPDSVELKIVDKYNANPQVRKQQQSLDGASAIKELASSGNPIAAAAIPTYMARASGEVGNLSEADKAPFGGSREILNRMEASLKQMSTGKLSEENKTFLIELGDIMEANANQNLDRHGREMADQYSKTSIGKEIGAEKIFQALRPYSTYKKKNQESKDVLKVGGTFHGEEIVGVKLVTP